MPQPSVFIIPELSRLQGFWGARTKAVFKTPVDALQMQHSSSPRGTASTSLHRPVVATHTSTGISAGCTRLFLNMERPSTAPAALRVSLVYTFTEWRCAFRHDGLKWKPVSIIGVHKTTSKWNSRIQMVHITDIKFGSKDIEKPL